MKSQARIWMLSFAALWAGGALAQEPAQTPAQTVASDPANDCPALPEALSTTIDWNERRFPGIVQCSALAREGGTELFALTISAESPFKPRRGDRAEKGTLANGEELQWYRGELASDAEAEVREALLRIAADRVVHVFLRAENPATLAERQRMVLLLPFPTYREN